jgi:alpha-1,2-mannosyltransferase
MAVQALLALIAAIPLVPIVGVYILRFILKTAGDHLRRKTSARRELITNRVEADAQQLHSAPHASQKPEDEDWERVESYAVGTAVNGDTHQEKDYAGVIGFFHPFW